jgi:hypothetical protein
MHDFDVKMFVQENDAIFTTCEKKIIQNLKSIQTLLSKDKPMFEFLGFLLFNVFPYDVFQIAKPQQQLLMYVVKSLPLNMVKLVHMGGIFQSSEIQLVERNQQIVHI